MAVQATELKVVPVAYFLGWLYLVASCPASPASEMRNTLRSAEPVGHSYESDWAPLKVGASFKKFVGPNGIQKVEGEKYRREWINVEEVRIEKLSVEVDWPAKRGGRERTLFYVDGADRVIIRDLTIVAGNADARMYDTIFLANVGEVIVQRVHLTGAVHRYHLRILNADRVYVDNLEISGIDYGTGLARAGGGLWIKNTPSGEEDAYRDPEWIQIQNCSITDYQTTAERRNQDAVYIESPGDGLLFNCLISNWGVEGIVGDGAIDVSFRHDQSPGGRLFRIERNILQNSTFAKTPGVGGRDNVVLWVNNIFVDTHLADYHGKWTSLYVYNTFVFSNQRRMYRMWRQQENGHTQLKGNVVVSSKPLNNVYYLDDTGISDKLGLLSTESNVYIMPEPGRWLRSVKTHLGTWSEWISAGFDKYGLFIDVVEEGFTKDYCGATLKAAGAKVDNAFQIGRQKIRIERDFFGNGRSERSTPGATVCEQ